MKTEERILEIENRISQLQKIVEQKDKKWDFSKAYNEYCEFFKKERDEISKLDRERRLIMIPALSELDNNGHVMTIKNFIATVKMGGFVDYDGFGRYVKDNQESDIEIYPSDVKYKSIRTDFDKIIWFNK